MLIFAMAAGFMAWGTGGNLQPEAADGSVLDVHPRQQGAKRYLSFELCGGITNQRLGLLDALLIAHATDRVAILPPMLGLAKMLLRCSSS